MSPEKTEPDVSSTDAGEGAAGPDTSTVSVDSTNGDHDPYFEPVVSLPEVVIRTNEEEEESVYMGRCKVFRYVAGSGREEGGEWKERGTGNVKLLKRADRGTIRLVMRQEKTLKIRANHYVSPYMKLRPNCGSDRAFVWYVIFDFADEQPKSEMFAIRFANAENARLFKEAFEEAIAYVTEEESKPETTEEDQEEQEEQEEDSQQTNQIKEATKDVKDDNTKVKMCETSAQNKEGETCSESNDENELKKSTELLEQQQREAEVLQSLDRLKVEESSRPCAS